MPRPLKYKMKIKLFNVKLINKKSYVQISHQISIKRFLTNFTIFMLIRGTTNLGNQAATDGTIFILAHTGLRKSDFCPASCSCRSLIFLVIDHHPPRYTQPL